MGSRAARSAPPAFVVCAQADSAYARALIQGEGWPLLFGRAVGLHAARVLGKGSRGIVVGHGASDGTALFLARGWRRAKAKRWLWVGMRMPPLGATVYLYSCYCAILASALGGSVVVGHYDQVPIPTTATDRAVRPFLAGIRILLEAKRRPSRVTLAAGARRLAGGIAKTETLLGPSLNLLAAVTLERSLIPPRKAGKP